MSEETYHIPAMLPQVLEQLDVKPDGIYIDATFGGGGHSRAILERLGENGHLYGFDQDADAMANIPDDPRFTFVHSNFRYAPNFMRYHGEEGVDGILADLGVSFHHFDAADRGFSFRSDAPLDMRMNGKASRTAADILAEADADTLADILYLYGELRNSRRLAAALVKARAEAPIATTGRLADVLRPLLKESSLKKEMAQVFQALRIEVNAEMTALNKFLNATPTLLKPGGRLVVLTYHSLEDRMVKNFMRTGNVEGHAERDFYGRLHCPWRTVGRQPLVPDEAEIEANPRSRSAKLRTAQLTDKED